MVSLEIGIIVRIEDLLAEGLEPLRALELTTCQLNVWNVDDYTEDHLKRLQGFIEEGLTISSLWAGWPGPKVWDFIDGPFTLGLVPTAYRAQRVDALKKGADFASRLGLTDLTTHVGFIPENPASTEYRETLIALKEIAGYCSDLGLYFNFETGQETPITLLRTMEDIGLKNLGINLDPANLLMYGKANPSDAVDLYGTKIRGVHIKDGLYPVNGRELGLETPVGEGAVDFPDIIEKLVTLGYDAPLIIEREIQGEKQIEDIKKAREMLLKIMERIQPPHN